MVVANGAALRECNVARVARAARNRAKRMVEEHDAQKLNLVEKVCARWNLEQSVDIVAQALTCIKLAREPTERGRLPTAAQQVE